MTAATAIANTDPGTDDERQPTMRQMLRPFWFVGALLMMLDGLTTYIALSRHSEQGARRSASGRSTSSVWPACAS